MWINVKDNTPNEGDVVLVRFNPTENDDGYYDYDYAVAYYDGAYFHPEGVEVIYSTSCIVFNKCAKIEEWKRIDKD